MILCSARDNEFVSELAEVDGDQSRPSTFFFRIRGKSQKVLVMNRKLRSSLSRSSLCSFVLGHGDLLWA